MGVAQEAWPEIVLVLLRQAVDRSVCVGLLLSLFTDPGRCAIDSSDPQRQRREVA
jgi:hypothetical protein